MKPDLDLLLEYVFGEPDEAQREEIGRRIREDENWRREHEKLLRVRTALDGERPRLSDPDAPYGYWERFNGRLMERIHPAPRPAVLAWRKYRSWTAPALALAALLVFFTTAVPTASDRIDFAVQTDAWLNSDTVVDALATYIQSGDLGESSVADESDDKSYEETPTSDFSVEDISLDVFSDMEQLSRQEQQVLLERLAKEDII